MNGWWLIFLWVIPLSLMIIGLSWTRYDTTTYLHMGEVRMVSFANSSKFQACQVKQLKWANARGITHVNTLGEADLDSDFQRRNAHILSLKRGFGYWIWKPYLILKTLQSIPEDEVMIYADACSRPDENLQQFIDRARQYGIAGYELRYPQVVYTKRDAYLLMGAEDQFRNPRLRQRSATVLALSNTRAVRQFVAQWLQMCEMERALTDVPSIEPNHPSFVEHRHDQSIFSVLTYKLSMGHFIGSRALGHHAFDHHWLRRWFDKLLT
jgi:hypothetical protein